MADQIKQGVHGCSREDGYVWPTEPEVNERLSWFQDQKLALMSHFGPYNQMGVCESWPLSDEEAEWGRREVDWETDVAEFKRQYRELNQSFNPMRLQPERWAEMAKRDGFRYLILTTKHHDGFCLYDTQYSDYKVTAPDCPFHAHRYADIVRHLFDAFRAQGLGIAAYFSKPDWHCPWYWAEGMDRPVGSTRNPTYDPEAHPEMWEQFVRFTHNQMMELIERYGRVDILWLDGGQVAPQNGQDIRLGELVERARRIQPGLLVADRTVGGPYENYITPELCIPDRALSVPWESCVPLGSAFSFRYDDTYKSPRTLVRMLTDVVSRGGNLALNIAPQPDGRLSANAVKSADGLGDWLRVNGEAIYGTRPCEICEAEGVAFTKKGEAVYALVRLAEGERLPGQCLIPWQGAVRDVTLLGRPEPIVWQKTERGIVASVPDALVGESPLALAYRIESARG